MPSWWSKSSSPKDPKVPKKPRKDGMRLQIGGWRTRLGSWTDDEKKNNLSPSSDISSSSRPISPSTPCGAESTRQPWPLPSSPLSPPGADVLARKNSQSFPLPPPRDEKPVEACVTSVSSSLSSSGSGDICKVSRECRSQANQASICLKAGGPCNADRSPCFSPCRSPRAILDAGDAFLTNGVVGRDKSPNVSPAPSPRLRSLKTTKLLQSGQQLSPRHTSSSHPLPSPPLPPAFPLSPSLSPSNRSAAATTCWQKGKLIGHGSFGYVYVGFDSNNIGRMCAMKEVHIIGDNDQSKESAKQLEQEITLLSRLRHQNIVQYYGSESVEDKLYIYLEYVSGGSIHKLLQDYGPFKESVIRRYTRQILSGLSFLHSMETVHRDIKGANILVDTNGVVKLADFGMAKHITAHSFPLSCKGSPYWMAPEILKSTHGYDLSVDIWSLGCTVIEMATGKPPWSDYEGVAVLFKIGNSRETPTVPQFLSEEGQHFLSLCLQRNPADRPTATELMEHPFVMDVPDSTMEYLTSYQPRSLNSPESYLSSARFTPPRQSQSAMFSTSAPSQFGFHEIESPEVVALDRRGFLQPDSATAFSDKRSFPRFRDGSADQFDVLQHPHQRIASYLDLKC